MPNGKGQHAIFLLRAVEFQLLDQPRGDGSVLHPPQRLCSRRWYPGGDGGGRFRWRRCGWEGDGVMEMVSENRVSEHVSASSAEVPACLSEHGYIPGGNPHQMFTVALTLHRCNCRLTFSVHILVLAYHPGLESLGLATLETPTRICW